MDGRIDRKIKRLLPDKFHQLKPEDVREVEGFLDGFLESMFQYREYCYGTKEQKKVTEMRNRATRLRAMAYFWKGYTGSNQ